MSELRKDPITNRWVVIASKRSKRPKDINHTRDISAGAGNVQNCPFCPGQEKQTPAEVFAIGPPGRKPDQPGWNVRVISNRFPIFESQGELSRQGYGFFDQISGIGIHEVVVETPIHSISLADLPVESIQKILQAYRDRLLYHRKNKALRYILIFRNYKPQAGASMTHPHSQIIGTPITPSLVKVKLDNSRAYYMEKERCLLCDLIQMESKLLYRVVNETEDFLTLCPFASCFPFEVWLCPKKHSHDFALLSDEGLFKVAEALKDMVCRIKQALDDPPYNFILNTSPNTHTRPGRPEYWQTLEYDFHWYIELIPRLTTIAGFEWGSNFYVNSVSPEDAAKHLRQVKGN